MLALAAVVGLGCFIYGYKTQETSTWRYAPSHVQTQSQNDELCTFVNVIKV